MLAQERPFVPCSEFLALPTPARAAAMRVAYDLYMQAIRRGYATPPKQGTFIVGIPGLEFLTLVDYACRQRQAEPVGTAILWLMGYR